MWLAADVGLSGSCALLPNEPSGWAMMWAMFDPLHVILTEP